MSRRIIAGVAAAGIAILASCSQDKSPNAFLPTEASLAKTPAPPTCSFSTATQDGRNYFTNSTGQTKDQALVSLDAMQSAGAGTAGATSAGFDVLRRVGVAVGTTAVKGTPAQGSVFVNDVLLCMAPLSVTGYVNPVDFSTALGAGGLFAVRTSAIGDNSAVVARSGRFGAEPTGTTWPVAGPTLFYGFPVSMGATFGNDPRVGTVFDIRTLPTQTFTEVVRVGVCDLTSPGRILHVHGTDPAVVLAIDLPTFCTGTFTSSEMPSSMFAVAAHQLANWLSPKPAYAARMMFTLSGGGGVRGFSVIGPIQVVDSIAFQGLVPQASVSDTTKATDGDPTTSQFTPIVQVRVVTRGGNALAGVTVTLTVVGNKGSFAASGGSAVTDSKGYASFPNFAINKPGGYTITAQAGEFGTTSFVATSNLFNIDGH